MFDAQRGVKKSVSEKFCFSMTASTKVPKGAMILGGVAVFIGSTYLANVVATTSKARRQTALLDRVEHQETNEPASVKSLHQKASLCIPTSQIRNQTFQELAAVYDDKIGRDEFVMGVPLLRRWLLRSAKGKCLEVAAGTGRNISYYSGADSVLLMDQSTEMVNICAKKAEHEHERFKFGSLLFSHGNKTHFTCQEGDAAIIPHADSTFDTIVDTFGLCSFDNPVQVLREMQRVCKPHGRILLLEHGRSHWQWLSKHLDRSSIEHATKWGCWWNRDIVNIIREAGLEVESKKTFHFGTTHYIIAAPSKSPVK